MKKASLMVILPLIVTTFSVNAAGEGRKVSDERIHVEGEVLTYVHSIETVTKTRDLQLGAEVFRRIDGSCYLRTTELTKLEKRVEMKGLELPHYTRVEQDLSSCELSLQDIE